jgi:hypothetical protein
MTLDMILKGGAWTLFVLAIIMAASSHGIAP